MIDWWKSSHDCASTSSLINHRKSEFDAAMLRIWQMPLEGCLTRALDNHGSLLTAGHTSRNTEVLDTDTRVTHLLPQGHLEAESRGVGID